MTTITAALSSVVTFFRGHRGDDRGATAVEYGLMVALIAAVIAVVVATLGTNLNDKFQGVSNCVGGTTTATCGK